MDGSDGSGTEYPDRTAQNGPSLRIKLLAPNCPHTKSMTGGPKNGQQKSAAKRTVGIDPGRRSDGPERRIAGRAWCIPMSIFFRYQNQRAPPDEKFSSPQFKKKKEFSSHHSSSGPIDHSPFLLPLSKPDPISFRRRRRRRRRDGSRRATRSDEAGKPSCGRSSSRWPDPLHEAAREEGKCSSSCRSSGCRRNGRSRRAFSLPYFSDPCGGKRAGSKLHQQEELPGAKRPRTTDLPCPPDNRGGGENNLLDYAVCPPPDDDGDNNNWTYFANNLLDIDSSAPKRPCPPDTDNNWRDWANLADGPAGLIAERVLAYDVADYVRFRAVCPPWRQCSTEPPRSHSGLDRRFHPWRWTMLREELADPNSRCFLNTSTGQCIQVHIPELHDHLLLAVTPEGLLVLVLHTQRATVRLLNPLTRHLTELPPLTTLLPPEHHRKILDRNLNFSVEFAAWGSGIANDDSTVVLCFNWLGMIGMAKPGDDSWNLLRYSGMITEAPLMFAGRFYCVTLSGVMVLEIGADHPPQLKLAAKLSMHVSQMADTVHLVNNCGELMLVHRRHRRLTAQNKSGRSYHAYRVDFNTGTLFPVKSLGGSGAGRAVSMGRYCSLSVSLGVFPSGSLSADTIYVSFDLRERILSTAGAYHLKSGRIEIPCSSVPPRPHTLIDCLSLSSTDTDC